MSSQSSEISAPPALPPRTGVEIGEWNVLEASIGKKGMGKSVHQCVRALELVRQAGGAYVIGHSLGQRLPERLPKELGGTKLPIKYHRTIAALDAGLRRSPGLWHVLAPALPEEGGDADAETADDLLRYVARLSIAVRRQAWAKKHPARALLGVPREARFLELHAPPIIVLIDEGIAIDAASTGDRAKGADKWFLQLIYSLRHMHVALLYAVQEPTSRSWRILEASTKIHVFHVRHEWALNALRACGASAEELDRIRNLPRFQHVTIETNGLPPGSLGDAPSGTAKP